MYAKTAVTTARLLVGAVTIVCTLVAGNVAAQDVKDEPDRSPRIRVKFGDLDLNTDAGRRVLLNRLSKAADSVCREYANSLATLGVPEVWASCYRHTLAAAVNKVNHEQVSTLFAAMSRSNSR